MQGKLHLRGEGELQLEGVLLVLLHPKSRRDDACASGTAQCMLQKAVSAPKILQSHLPGLERSASKALVCIYRERQGCSQECIPCGCLRRYILVTVPIHSNNMN